MLREYPDMVHIEYNTMHRPSWTEQDQIYGPKIVDWSQNYVIHLWKNELRGRYAETLKNASPENIKYMNTTFGEIARYIYYSDARLFGRATDL